MKKGYYQISIGFYKIKMKKKINHCFICLFVYFLFSNNAYAYLDPGSGSIILQVLIAFLAAVGTFISIYWKKLKNFISNLLQIIKKNKNNKKK